MGFHFSQDVWYRIRVGPFQDLAAFQSTRARPTAFLPFDHPELGLKLRLFASYAKWVVTIIFITKNREVQLQRNLKEGAAMKQQLSYSVLRTENQIFAGSSGVSQGNRAHGFIPAFFEAHSGKTVVSQYANGSPAPIHLLDSLPQEWVVARDRSGRVVAVKDSVIAGFIYQGRFYTREQAAQAVSH